MILGQGDLGRSYLVFKSAEPSDFEMKFSYRFPGKGNSGVNIRAIPDETGTRDYQSYHVDLGHIGIGDNVLGAWDFHTPGRKEHGVRRGHRLVIDENDGASVTKLKDAVSISDIHRHDWNHVHIVVSRNRYTFSINGKPSAEFTEHLPEKRRLLKGMIQLQHHDPGMVVEFRDLQLKVLK